MLNPDALLYRRAKGLQDYDERMAVLIQVVQGEQFGRYFMPHAAGVAFSRNLYRWSPQIRREDGFVRLVWGLGTRAVDRVGNDYPRLVALSHPLLHPEVVGQGHPPLFAAVCRPDRPGRQRLQNPAGASRCCGPITRCCATWSQVDQGDYLAPMRMLLREGENKNLVLTFDELLRRTPLAKRMSKHAADPGDALPFPGGYRVHRPGGRSRQPAPRGARSPCCSAARRATCRKARPACRPTWNPRISSFPPAAWRPKGGSATSAT